MGIYKIFLSTSPRNPILMGFFAYLCSICPKPTTIGLYMTWQAYILGDIDSSIHPMVKATSVLDISNKAT